MNCKIVIKQIICIKQNPSKIPIYIILKQPAVKIMIVIYFLFIFLTAITFSLQCSRDWGGVLSDDPNKGCAGNYVIRSLASGLC